MVLHHGWSPCCVLACCCEEPLRGAGADFVSVGDLGGGEGRSAGQFGDLGDTRVVAGTWCSVARVARPLAGVVVPPVACVASGVDGVARPPGPAVSVGALGQVAGAGVGADGGGVDTEEGSGLLVGEEVARVEARAGKGGDRLARDVSEGLVGVLEPQSCAGVDHLDAGSEVGAMSAPPGVQGQAAGGGDVVLGHGGASVGDHPCRSLSVGRGQRAVRRTPSGVGVGRAAGAAVCAPEGGRRTGRRPEAPSDGCVRARLRPMGRPPRSRAASGSGWATGVRAGSGPTGRVPLIGLPATAALAPGVRPSGGRRIAP